MWVQPDAGELEIGQTVVPMYSSQSRDSLDSNKTLFEEVLPTPCCPVLIVADL
jgi:hypothetical protein